jgi:hypothetical protein
MHVDENYNISQKKGLIAHSLTNIVRALRLSLQGDDWLGILEYFVFDCWIGNTDRHHENWGIIQVTHKNKNPYFYLAPSYDHGAAMAATRLPEFKIELIKSESMKKFYRKGKSAVYNDSGRILPFHELALACFEMEISQTKKCIKCSNYISKIEKFGENWVKMILDRFPKSVLTSLDRDFICDYTGISKNELIKIKNNFSRLAR